MPNNEGLAFGYQDTHLFHFEGMSRGCEISRGYLLLVQLDNCGRHALGFSSFSKEWRHRQVRKISDKAFDRYKNQSGRANLTFEDLYIAVLLVYNDINKHLPGPHFDPPSKEQVRAMIQTCDIDLDGDLDREEFAMFMQKMTADTFILVSQGLIVTLVVAPAVALATKRATEGVPRVGKVVQRIPNSVFASLVTLAVVMFQTSSQEID